MQQQQQQPAAFSSFSNTEVLMATTSADNHDGGGGGGGGGGKTHHDNDDDDGDSATAAAAAESQQHYSSSSNSFSPMDMEAWKETALRSNPKCRIAGWLLEWFAQSGQQRPPPLPPPAAASVGANDDDDDDDDDDETKTTKTTRGGKCEKTKHVRLIAISVSMYVEKVRWILDMLENHHLSDVFFTEECHPPGIASYYTIQASQDKASQSPMIVITSTTSTSREEEEEEEENRNDSSANGKQQQQQQQQQPVLWGSDTIIRELCDCEGSPLKFLYPAEIQQDIQKVETDLGQRLGASARCLAYNALLRPKYYESATKVLTNHSPYIERMLYKLLLKTGTVPKIMAQTLGTRNPTVIEKCYQDLRDVFTEMSQRLEKSATTVKGRDDDNNNDNNNNKNDKRNYNDNDDVYLMDTPQKRYGLTVVDITFASLAYIVLRPPELKPLHIDDDEMPPELMELNKELTATTAGKHALKVYQKYRPIDPTTGCITIKCVNQNKNIPHFFFD